MCSGHELIDFLTLTFSEAMRTQVLLRRSIQAQYQPYICVEVICVDNDQVHPPSTYSPYHLRSLHRASTHPKAVQQDPAALFSTSSHTANIHLPHAIACNLPARSSSERQGRHTLWLMRYGTTTKSRHQLFQSRVQVKPRRRGRGQIVVSRQRGPQNVRVRQSGWPEFSDFPYSRTHQM